jgi:hypothetical protein
MKGAHADMVIVDEAASMEASFTGGWHIYTCRSQHLLDARYYEPVEPGGRCYVKFFTHFNTNSPGIWVRFLKVDVPKALPLSNEIGVETETTEYTRIYSPRRYLWFFEGLEDEKRIRKMYEGVTGGGRIIKRKMVAY